MTGSKPNFYFIISWLVTCPLTLLVILGASLYSLFSEVQTYETWNPELGKKLKTDFPVWAYVIIIILVFLSVSCIPLTALCRKLNICKPESWVKYGTNRTDNKQVTDYTVTDSTQPLTAKV